MIKYVLEKKYVIYVVSEDGYLMKDGRIYDAKEHRSSRGYPAQFDYDYEAKHFIKENDFGYWTYEIRPVYCKEIKTD